MSLDTSYRVSLRSRGIVAGLRGFSSRLQLQLPLSKFSNAFPRRGQLISNRELCSILSPATRMRKLTTDFGQFYHTKYFTELRKRDRNHKYGKVRFHVKNNNPILANVELIFNCMKLMYIAGTSVSINYVATYSVNTRVAKLRCAIPLGQQQFIK